MSNGGSIEAQTHTVRNRLVHRNLTPKPARRETNHPFAPKKKKKKKKGGEERRKKRTKILSTSGIELTVSGLQPAIISSKGAAKSPAEESRRASRIQEKA